jgi:hypothetical protein
MSNWPNKCLIGKKAHMMLIWMFDFNLKEICLFVNNDVGKDHNLGTMYDFEIVIPLLTFVY